MVIILTQGQKIVKREIDKAKETLEDTIHPETKTVIKPGDRILLCSDGIHDNLTDAEIESILLREPRTIAARNLVQNAINRSHEECLRAKKDHMSAIVITCNG